MEVVIAIDDLHPEKGWGCEGDECVGYLEKLNEEFGCKFTLFIPSNYHGKYPLSKHKGWVDFWKKKDPIAILEKTLEPEEKTRYLEFCDVLKSEIDDAFSFAKNDLPPNEDTTHTQVRSDL